LDKYSPLPSEVSLELPTGGALEGGGGVGVQTIHSSTNQFKSFETCNFASVGDEFLYNLSFFKDGT